MCLGIPGQIVQITDVSRMMALADISGVRREVNVSCIADGPLETLEGAWTLIHVGFAEAPECFQSLLGLVFVNQRHGEAQETLEALEEGARAMEETAP